MTNQLSRTGLLQSRAAVSPHGSHHIENVAVPINLSARQSLANVPRPHDDQVTDLRHKFSSGGNMNDRSVFDLELRSVYLGFACAPPPATMLQ